MIKEAITNVAIPMLLAVGGPACHRTSATTAPTSVSQPSCSCPTSGFGPVCRPNAFGQGTANVDEAYWVVFGFPTERVDANGVGHLRQGETLRLTWEPEVGFAGGAAAAITQVRWESTNPILVRVDGDSRLSSVLTAVSRGELGPTATPPFLGPIYASASFADGSCTTQDLLACGPLPAGCKRFSRLVVE